MSQIWLDMSATDKCVSLQVRLARKEWVKEQAAAHLARSTAAHTTTILQGWREIAAVQRCQRWANATNGVQLT